MNIKTVSVTYILSFLLLIIYNKIIVIKLMAYHIESLHLNLCVATKIAQDVEEAIAENIEMLMGND